MRTLNRAALALGLVLIIASARADGLFTPTGHGVGDSQGIQVWNGTGNGGGGGSCAGVIDGSVGCPLPMLGM